jgi:hypothetical protein
MTIFYAWRPPDPLGLALMACAGSGTGTDTGGEQMIVSSGFVKAYPRLAMWICDNLPDVRKRKAKVFKEFQKYAELSEKVAERALRHGNPPVIEFRYIPTANGEFIGKKYPDTVFIAMDICDRFQRSEADAKDPRMHLLVESTLLHEIVHWGDWTNGKVASFEAGKAFEKAAYGKDIRRYW